MTSATALVPAANLPRTFDELARHLRVTASPVPRVVIDQEPGVGAQYALAAMHLTFASVLIWHATLALPGAVNAAVCRRLARIPRTKLLKLSSFGLVGWTWAIAVTVLFIWR